MDRKHRYQELLPQIPDNYRVSNHEVDETDFYTLYGKPYNYPSTNTTEYSFLPFGQPYSVLQTPQLNASSHIRILSIVLSSTCDFDTRKYVRSKTSSYYEKYRVRPIFALSSDEVCNVEVGRENGQFGDILQFSHQNSYKNISLSVLYSFQYLQSRQLSVDFVFKTDTDCVVNYPLLNQTISKYEQNREYLYMGNCHSGEMFNTRWPDRKNYVPPSVVGKTRIPTYASGGGYVISYKLLPKLLIAMRHVNYLTHHEDVNVGKGMDLLNVECVDKTAIWIARSGCRFSWTCLKKIIMHPKKSPSEIERFYSYIAN